MFSIPPEHVTIGEAFQDAGYRTRIISKWHQDRASLARSFAGGDRIMGLGAYRQFQRAYRKGPYKLIEYVRAKDFTKQSGEFESGSRVTQLFNVRRDPWETTDLSFLPESRELVASLREAMRDGRVRDLLQIAFCVGIALNLRRAFRGLCAEYSAIKSHAPGERIAPSALHPF